MDENIFKYISILLPRHKCITIPQFGAFILNKEESQLFDVNSYIVPPSCSIIFNSELQHDDGVLVSYMQTVSEISYEKAGRELHEVVKALKKQLHIDGMVSCGELGKIEFADGVITFSPNKDYTLPSHYGLEPVKLNTLTAINRSLEKDARRFNLRKKAIIASASVAASFLLLFPTGVITDGQSKETAAVEAGFLKSLERKGTHVIAEQPMINELDASELYTTATAPISQEVTPVKEVVTNKKSGRTYYMIIGGATSAKAADKLLDVFRQDGFENAQIIESPDRIRIYIQSFDDKMNAEQAVIQFRKNNPKYDTAWIHSQKN